MIKTFLLILLIFNVIGINETLKTIRDEIDYNRTSFEYARVVSDVHRFCGVLDSCVHKLLKCIDIQNNKINGFDFPNSYITCVTGKSRFEARDD